MLPLVSERPAGAKKTICDLTEREALICLLKAEKGVVAAQILNTITSKGRDIRRRGSSGQDGFMNKNKPTHQLLKTVNYFLRSALKSYG